MGAGISSPVWRALEDLAEHDPEVADMWLAYRRGDIDAAQLVTGELPVGGRASPRPRARTEDAHDIIRALADLLGGATTAERASNVAIAIERYERSPARRLALAPAADERARLLHRLFAACPTPPRSPRQITRIISMA